MNSPQRLHEVRLRGLAVRCIVFIFRDARQRLHASRPVSDRPACVFVRDERRRPRRA
jgi:hypothetical protein